MVELVLDPPGTRAIARSNPRLANPLPTTQCILHPPEAAQRFLLAGLGRASLYSHDDIGVYAWFCDGAPVTGENDVSWVWTTHQS